MLMPILQKSKPLIWTVHARAKMQFYKLSPSRVLHVLHSPRRIEEGVAPKTVAAMQPGSIKKSGSRAGLRAGRAGSQAGGQTETWSQEIWVMFQDSPKERVIISAWRYPGVTKARSAAMKQIMRQEYGDFMSKK